MHMISRIALAALLVGLIPYRLAHAEEVIIKLGTLVPVGSPWHLLLKQAAQEFEAVSGGRVKLRVYAGGTMGNEGDMVKKMRYGQLQAAALSTIGLHEITAEPMALDLPMLVENTEEREYVLSKIGPRLEAALNNNGYVLLNWSEVGMTRFFTTEARPTIDAMRKGKIFVWDGDPHSAAAWRAGGFHPVVLSSTDIISSLTTGMIDTVVYPPSYALAMRIHEKARYMHDFIWSSLTGATVVSKATWDKVPQDVRPKLLDVARALGRQTVEKAREMEAEALTKMKAQGLQVVPITDRSGWEAAAKAANGVVRGKVVPADLFDEVHRLVSEFRKQRSKK
ncbi:MAG: TRAP transporter substrate-binding protein DctP [Myxococcota bacterium]|nr:TRAP transporter substrate-binding protein DctP [Myxococcota bacterium]